MAIFNGPPPVIQTLKSDDEEIKAVAAWIVGHSKAGMMPPEFGLFVRSANQLSRAQAAAKEASVTFKVLDEKVETTSGHISIGTMHLAKGPEFRTVAVMACDDEVVPLQERIETVTAHAPGCCRGSLHLHRKSLSSAWHGSNPVRSSPRPSTTSLLNFNRISAP
jgi:hypothetical protein